MVQGSEICLKGSEKVYHSYYYGRFILFDNLFFAEKNLKLRAKLEFVHPTQLRDETIAAVFIDCSIIWISLS